MKDLEEKEAPATKQQIKTEIQAAAGRIKREIRDNLMKSVHKSFDLCVASGSDTIDY